MADFGSYASVRRLSRTGFTSLYLGRAETDDTPRHAIKCFEPCAYVHDEKVVAVRGHDFLESAENQRIVAGHDPVHWVAVHTIGSAEDTPYFVTDYYPHSLQFLIEGRARLRVHGLHHIVSAVVAGLRSLKDAQGRPHANLKPGNILLSPGATLLDTSVKLNDPLPETYVDARTHWQVDLHDLGEMIHQLVTHRHTSVIRGWQAPAGPEWQRLGKQGEDWRTLCNRLLLADIDPQAIQLESLEAELHKLKPKRPLTLKRLLVRCAAAILLIVAGFLAWPYLRPFIRPTPWDQSAWERWVPAYCEWIFPLREHLKEQYTHWESQDVEAAKTLKENVDIGSVPAQTSRDNLLLSIQEVYQKAGNKCPPPLEKWVTLRKSRDNDATVQAIIKASDAVLQLDAYLFQPDANTTWPHLQAVRAEAAQLERRGLNPMFRFLSEHLDRLQPDANLPGSLDVFFSLQAGYRDAKVKVDFERLHHSVMDAAEMVREVNDVTEYLLRRNEQLPQYHLLDDTTLAALKVDYQAAQDRMVVAQDNLEKAVNEYQDREARQGLEDLNDLAIELTDMAGLPLIEKNRNPLEQGYSGIVKRIQAIDIDPNEWWDVTKETALDTASATLNRYWQEYRDHWLGVKHTKTELNIDLYWDLRGRMRKARENIKALDKSMPSQIPLMADWPVWTQQVTTYYENTRRESLLQAMTQGLYFDDPFPRVDVKDPNRRVDDATRSSVPPPQAWQKHLDWPDRVQNLLADLVALERHLNAWYGWQEAGEEGHTMRDLFEPWRESTWLKELTTSAALGPVQQLVERVETLARITTLVPDELIRLARTPASRTEAVWAIWRNLGKDNSQAWPVDKDQWQDDAVLQGRISEALPQLEVDDQRKQELETLFTRESLRRHQILIGVLAAGDDTLKEFSQTQLRAAADDLGLARNLTQFLISDSNWPAGYNLKAFYAQDANLAEPLVTKRCGYWLREVPAWRIIEDPRLLNNAPALVETIEQMIQTGQAEASDDPEVLAQLEGDKNQLEELQLALAAFANPQQYPAVVKYREQMSLWDGHFQDLRGLKDIVESHIRPHYCLRLRSLRGGRLAFKESLSQFAAFEPVRFVNGHFVTELPGNFVRLKDFEDFPELRDNVFAFIESTDAQGERNVGWPRYIQSTQDRSVVLMFVPALQATDKPHYMALSEITNAQYLRCIREKTAARKYLIPPGNEKTSFWSYKPVLLIMDPEAIKKMLPAIQLIKDQALEDTGFGDHPVVWLTSEGARFYTEEWLGASLPSAAHHKQAAEYVAEQLTGQTDFRHSPIYHVRDAKWWSTPFKEYNTYAKVQNDPNTKFNPNVKLFPFGAVWDEGFVDGKPLIHEELTLRRDQFAYTPSVSSQWNLTDTASPPFIHDLVGNVWEWCMEDGDPQQSVICGGSCLSHLDYARPGAKVRLDDAACSPMFKRDGAACDVGFRAMVPCLETLGIRSHP